MKKLKTLEKVIKANFCMTDSLAIPTEPGCRIKAVRIFDMPPYSALALFCHFADDMGASWTQISNYLMINLDHVTKAMNSHAELISGPHYRKYKIKMSLVSNGLKFQNEEVQG